MQTFLPYADFAETAATLDMKRLGKQRVETMQLLNALLVPDKGWKNHPATKMWEGHELALLEYQIAVCEEWTHERGFKDTCLDKSIDIVAAAMPDEFLDYSCGAPAAMPLWLGDEDFHLAHQSNLLRKNPEYYSIFFPDVPDDLEYIWPTP